MFSRCPAWLAALLAALLGVLVSVPSWGRTGSGDTPIVFLADVSIAPTGDNRLAVTFTAFGRSFTATLEAADPFAPGASDVWLDASGSMTEEPKRLFYAGALAGNDSGWVRLAVRGRTLEGVVWTADDIYFIEPATAVDVTADAQATIAYRLSDLGATWDAALCGASSTKRCGGGASCASVRGETLAERVAAMLRGSSAAAGSRAALIGDYGFFERYGSDAASEMALVWHVVAGFDGPLKPPGSIDTTIVHTAPGVPSWVGVAPTDVRYRFAARRFASDSRRQRACVAHTGQTVAAWAQSGGKPLTAGPVATPAARLEPPTPNASFRSFETAPATSFNTLAQAAIGQPSVLSNILNQVGPAGLYFPYDIARDPSVPQTRFYVVDAFSSRVLGFECAGANCALPTLSVATRVFGQPDFVHHDQNGGLLGGVSATVLNFPFGAAVSATGTLFVADSGNNRVLVYQNPWSDAVADVVLGQPSMSASAPGSGLNQLRGPQGVFVDGTGALWVADTGNNRVLKFTSITTGASAAFAIGGSGAASAATLSGPCDAVVDGGGNLFVADTGFNRVLRYAPPLTGGMSASVVFGHAGSMANGTANQGGVSANSLAAPEKLALDGNGRLWVSDTANNRVLEYDTPITSQTATRVFGQASRSQVPMFTSGGFDAPDGFPNAAGFWGPRGIAFDGNGTLWIVDRDNSRVLGFDMPLGAAPAAIIADRMLGKADFVGSYANLPTQTRVNNPVALGVDRSHTPNRLWIADIGNNRVLGYASTANLPSDQPADRVLGQSSFTGGSTNAGINGSLQNAVTAVASASSLFFPMGVAVDSHGGVYVGDTSNSRVLHFLDPFATDTTADRVFGQGSFTTRNPSFPYGTANSLAGLGGVSIGPADELWVADTLDHRVVRFSNAPAQPTTGATADLVLGQSGFASSSTFPAYAPGCAAARMNAPLGVFAASSNHLYVADSGNNRVLVFTPPFSNGMSASAVFGQSGFTACSPNRGGAPGAATLSNPQGVYEDDAGTVYIADAGNQRVLIYTAPFAGGDLIADAVIGQPDFTSTNVPPPRPDTLCQPAAVAGDAVGNLFVADRENSRTLRYALNQPPTVLLDSISDPISVGAFNGLTGSGFTAGSLVVLFVAAGNGVTQVGPFSPFSANSGSIVWFAPAQIPLGNGFASVQVVNSDQGYIASNVQPALLYGAASAGFPTIIAVNGMGLNPADPSVPLANVSTALPQSATITIAGSGFSNPVVALYSSNPNAAALEPVAPPTSTQIEVQIPADIPTGPGSIQILNRPSFTGSQLVSVPIGEQIRLDSVRQSNQTITVMGAGFSARTIISFFNAQNGAVVNFGGVVNGTQSKIPFTLASSHQLGFDIPAGARSGAAYVQLLNPPFIPFTSTGNSPNGAINISVP